MSHPAPSPPIPSPAPLTPSGHTASWAGANGAGPAVWVKSVLPRSVAALAASLGANSEDWKPRITALQDLEKLVLDCKAYEQSSAGTAAAASFPVTLGALLFSLAPALSTQISDLRSEIVRQAAHTISALATQLGDQVAPGGESSIQGPFHKCGAKILPSVLAMASSSNSVMRGYALQAAQDVVAHVMNGQGVLGHLLSEVKHTKNKNLKSLSMELIAETVLKSWPRKLWGGGAAATADSTPRSGGGAGSGTGAGGAAPAISNLMLEEHLLLGLASADTLTRGNAARAVWHYARFGSAARAQAMVKAMEPRMRKIVLDAVTADDKGISLEESSDDVPATASSALARSRSNSLSAAVNAAATGRKTPTSAASRTPNFGALNGSASGSSGAEDDGTGTGSMKPLNLSSTSISDGILTKALTEARRKMAAAPSSGGAATGAPAASGTTGTHATASGLGGAGAKRVGTTATSSAAPAPSGLKKPSALGAPSRVLMKKPPPSAAATAAPVAGLKGSSSTAASRVPATSAASAAAAACLEADGDAELASLLAASTPSADPQRSHARTISTFRLDDLQGLLNDTELTISTPPAGDDPATAAATAEGLDGATVAAAAAPNAAADGSAIVPLSDDSNALPPLDSSPSRHLRSLSIQSNAADAIVVTEPVVFASPLQAPPAQATKSAAVASSSASTGRRTPGAPVTKTATPGAVNTSASKRPATAAIAAAALLKQPVPHSASKLPLKPTPSALSDPKKRASLPASGASTARGGSATTSNTPSNPRRSLVSASRPASRSASKIRPPGSISASVSGRGSPTNSEHGSMRSPTTPRGSSAKRSSSVSARRPPPISAAAAAAAGRKTPNPKTPVPTTPRSSRGTRPVTPSASRKKSTTGGADTPGTVRRGGAASGSGSRTPGKSPARFPKPLSLSALANAFGSPLASPMPPIDIAALAQSMRGFGASGSAGLASPHSASAASASSGSRTPRSSLSSSSPGSSAFSSNGLSYASGDLALLLKDHRAHMSDCSVHLQHLNGHYVAVSAALGSLGPAVVPQGGQYLDNMISLLSESLAKTTRVLEAFMALKRIEIATAQAKQKEQQLSVQAALLALTSPQHASQEQAQAQGPAGASAGVDASMSFPPLPSGDPALSSSVSTESASSGSLLHNEATAAASSLLFPPQSPVLAAAESQNAALQDDAPRSLDEPIDASIASENPALAAATVDATSPAALSEDPLLDASQPSAVSPSSRMHVLSAIYTDHASFDQSGADAAPPPAPASPQAALIDLAPSSFPAPSPAQDDPAAVAPAAVAAESSSVEQSHTAAAPSTAAAAGDAPSALADAAAPASSDPPAAAAPAAAAAAPRAGSVAAMLAKFGHNSATSSRETSRTVSREPSPGRFNAAAATSHTREPPVLAAADRDEY